MKNRISTKRALFSSIVSLLLCFTMLLGSTYAWFTDSVSSAHNTILAGNLDMKVFYKPYGEEYTKWTEVDETTDIFSDDSYEPGYTKAVWFEVKNTGTLAFKYKMNLNVLDEKEGTNVNIKTFRLSDFLRVKSGFYGSEYENYEKQYKDRELLLSAINTNATELSNLEIPIIEDSEEEGEENIVVPNCTEYVCVVLYMPEDIGNAANHNGHEEDIPYIDLGITAIATQAPSEPDSFGNTYDVDATYKN